jgi:hypothetical protein
MIRMRFSSLAAFAAATLACWASVQGALLPIGGAFLAPPEPDPVGGVLIASTVQPFVTPPGVGQFSGVLTTLVYQDDPTNPFAGIGDPAPANHGLTFVFQLHNDATSTTSLGRMTTVDFSAFQTDVSYQVPSAGLPPTSVDRGTVPGVTIGWSFTGAPVGLGRILPGLSTAPMVVQTDAPGYVSVLANVIDGSVVQVPTFGPTPNPPGGGFPEPSSLMLLLLGTCGLVRHRQNRPTR